MTAARAAADLAALLPMDHPLARVARLRLDAHVRAERGPTMRRLDDDSTTEGPVIADPRLVTTRRPGTPVRDAAVNPRPGDHRAPVNAGQPGTAGDPHGPNVVAL